MDGERAEPVGFNVQEYPEGQERQPVPVDFMPGAYVVMSLETWEQLHNEVEALKKKAGVEKLAKAVIYSQFEVPDTGPRVCPFCGLDHWMHRSRCRMLYNDPNDPDAEY